MSSTIRCTTLCSALAIALCASPASADATLSFSSTTPDTTGAIYQLNHDSSNDLTRRSDETGWMTHQWFGQTFTVEPGGLTLDKISFLVFQEDSEDRMTSGMTLSIDVYNVNSLSDQSGTTVFTSPQTAVTPNFAKGQYLWMTFDVEDHALAPGIYGMTLDFAFALDNLQGGHKLGGDHPAGIQFVTDSDPYAGGQAWREPPGFGSNNDLTFVINGTAVPEPSSVVLCTLCLVGLVAVGARRRQKR